MTLSTIVFFLFISSYSQILYNKINKGWSMMLKIAASTETLQQIPFATIFGLMKVWGTGNLSTSAVLVYLGSNQCFSQRSFTVYIARNYAFFQIICTPTLYVTEVLKYPVEGRGILQRGVGHYQFRVVFKWKRHYVDYTPAPHLQSVDPFSVWWP